MSTAREIYEAYEVPPWLQEHQIRVAAVGKMVAESFPRHVDVSLVITTCLLHDIGAIVKFDFSEKFLADLFAADEVPHWERVQANIRERYGRGEHAATDAILAELGAEREREVFKHTGLTRLADILSEGTPEVRIVQYSDTRVGPRGIVTIAERIEDARVRYSSKGHNWFERLDQFRMLSLELENMVLADTSIAPNEISDETIVPHARALWDYHIA